jgi:hypothetical protein
MRIQVTNKYLIEKKDSSYNNAWIQIQHKYMHEKQDIRVEKVFKRF